MTCDPGEITQLSVHIGMYAKYGVYWVFCGFFGLLCVGLLLGFLLVDVSHSCSLFESYRVDYRFSAWTLQLMLDDRFLTGLYVVLYVFNTCSLSDEHTHLRFVSSWPLSFPIPKPIGFFKNLRFTSSYTLFTALEHWSLLNSISFCIWNSEFLTKPRFVSCWFTCSARSGHRLKGYRTVGGLFIHVWCCACFSSAAL